MSTDYFVKVVNSGGGNAGVPNGEWICRQDKFCSYAPSSLSGWALSQFSDYNGFADWLPTDTSNYGKQTMVLLTDGSAKYGEPVCPSSNCEAVLFYDDYMQHRRASCPIGTEMELRLTVQAGSFNRCATPDADVILSGNLPAGCNIVSGSYCCPAGSVSVLHFVHQTAPCQPGSEDGAPCIYPQTGRAYGLCGVDGTCVRNLEASEVVQELSVTNAPSQSPVQMPVADPTNSPVKTLTQSPVKSIGQAPAPPVPSPATATRGAGPLAMIIIGPALAKRFKLF